MLIYYYTLGFLFLPVLQIRVYVVNDVKLVDIFGPNVCLIVKLVDIVGLNRCSVGATKED